MLTRVHDQSEMAAKKEARRRMLHEIHWSDERLLSVEAFRVAARGVASPSPSEPSLATMDMNHMMRWPKSPSHMILLSAFLLLPVSCYVRSSQILLINNLSLCSSQLTSTHIDFIEATRV